MRRLTSMIVLGGLFSFSLSLLAMSGSAYAATITVNTTDPQAYGGTECSIQDAFAAVSDNVAVGGCIAGDPMPVVDTIVLQNGTYDFQFADIPVSATESFHLKGQSRTGTKLVDGRLTTYQYQSGELSDITFEHFDVDSIWTGGEAGHAYDVHDVSLESSELCIRPNIAGEMNDVPLDATFTNITGTADPGGDGSTINILSEGETFVRNVSLDATGADFNQADEFGDPSRPQAIWHVSSGSDKLHIENSYISDYPIALTNDECFEVPAGPAWSVYMTNVYVKDMTDAAIRNQCGHVVINRSTFSGIDGPLILGELSDDDNSRYSYIEIYSSTFDGVQGNGNCDSIICFSFSGDGSPAKGTNRIRIKQSTFSENNVDKLFGYMTPSQDLGILAVEDASFDEVIIQNNALGTNYDPSFLPSTLVTVSGNLTTGQPSPGVQTVSTLGLGSLQDNGGSSQIGEGGSGGNVPTMLPMVGSPLIDGACASAGINEDQRGSERDQMSCFDVGAMEVTLAEYVAMGGAWSPASGDGTQQTPGAPATGKGGDLHSFAISAAVVFGGLLATWFLVRLFRRIY